MVGEGPLDRARAVHGRAGRVERREEAVTGRVHDLAGALRDQAPQHVVVPAQQPFPRLVTERLGKLRRTHDVCEEEGHSNLEAARAAFFEVTQLGLYRRQV